MGNTEVSMNNINLSNILADIELQTPAFVIDMDSLVIEASKVKRLTQDVNIKLLFALKSFSILRGLEVIADIVDGFSASSLYEARLAHMLCKSHQTTHLTTPGIRPDEIKALCQNVDYIAFNSIEQWHRYKAHVVGSVSCGLRINPSLSFVQDDRYNPCRKNSKLGIPLDHFKNVLRENPAQFDGIQGLHFHNNSESMSLEPLLQTVGNLTDSLNYMRGQIKWLNLGGGYLFKKDTDSNVLKQVDAQLADYDFKSIFIEPGTAIARSAGFIVSTVVDLFDSGDTKIAVLDTSVNHMPEVFEYQYQPVVVGNHAEGAHAYLLAGSSCLAGDLFGCYHFDVALQIGSRIVFPNTGVYTMVKANMFNGINLPSIYLLHDSEYVELVKHFDFTDFLSLCGEGHVKNI